MNRRPDEFSLHISWKRPGMGRYGSDQAPTSVPGLHVTAGWANEGEAFYPIDNLRLDAGAIMGLADVLDETFNMDGSFSAAADELSIAQDKAADEHAIALRARVETLRRQLVEAEAALASRGVLPERLRTT